MVIDGWESAELRETHISMVFLAEDRVLKVKKAVALGFLDFSTPQRQRAACEAERALNDRTAPGVTLGVRSITRTERPEHFEVDGAGEVAHWAVEMTRLPDDRRLQARLDAGALDGPTIDRVAAWLASFHELAPPRPEHGGGSVVVALMEENFAQLPEASTLVGADAVAAMQRWQRHALRPELVEQRRRAGRVRDGHGDLRLDHVYLMGADVVAIDGIEFDERYRCLDVAADLGFLVMDLHAHGRPDLAERLAARWASHTGDWDVYGVLDGYVAYRAWVRAKVRHLQGDPEAARRRLAVALERTRPPAEPPRLVVVGGPIAAGKSTLAGLVGSMLRAPVIDADRTRKQLAGVAPDSRLGAEAFAGAYSDEATSRVYDALMDYAGIVIRSGRTAVLDASFRTQALRDRARQAGARLGVPVRMVACTAPEPVLRARLEARHGRPAEVSDARAPLLTEFLARYEVPSGSDVLVVDTSSEVDEPQLKAFLAA